MLLKNLSCRFQIGRLSSSNQIIFGHYIIDMFIHVSFETQITVCHNPDQIFLIIYNRNTTNLILCHQSQSITNGRASLYRHRIINHSVLGTLYNSYLTCLFFNRHIFVYHADTSFPCNGNSHFRFGHRIHSCGHKRDF